MKRTIYLIAFTIFGVLLQFLAHALLEMGVISLLLRDFNRYGLGLTWAQWFAVHQTLSFAFLIVGIAYGYRAGLYWWNAIYVQKRFGWPPRWKRSS